MKEELELWGKPICPSELRKNPWSRNIPSEFFHISEKCDQSLQLSLEVVFYSWGNPEWTDNERMFPNDASTVCKIFFHEDRSKQWTTLFTQFNLLCEVLIIFWFINIDKLVRTNKSKNPRKQQNVCP